MAIVSEPKSVKVNMKLNNGLDQAGNIKTVNVSIGSLSVSAFDAQKAYNIVGLAAQCLDKSVYAIEKSSVDTLLDE